MKVGKIRDLSKSVKEQRRKDEEMRLNGLNGLKGSKGRWVDGEMGRWGDGEKGRKLNDGFYVVVAD